jgi:hypothetical protein
MLALFIVSVLFILVPLTLYLLWYYADRTTNHPVTLCIVFFGWLLAFSVLLLVPTDVESTFSRRCQSRPAGPEGCDTPSPFHVDHDVLVGIWGTVYWSIFALCWVVAPLAQEYVQAGAFTVLGKVRYSLKNNAIMYGVFLALFIAFAIYLAAAKHMRGAALVGFVLAAANCWGLFVLICTLGHGLVAVPRGLWHAGDRLRTLRHTQFRAGKAYEELEEARGDLADIVDELRSIARAVPRHEGALRSCIETIVEAVPTHFNVHLPWLGGGGDGVGGGGDGGDIEGGLDRIGAANNTAATSRRRQPSAYDGEVNAALLERVHWQVKKANFACRTAHGRFQRLVDAVTRIEDVIKSEAVADRTVRWSHRGPRAGPLGPALDRAEWLYLVHLQPTTTRALAVVLGIVSVIIVWCEVTIFKVDPDYSLLSRMVHARESRLTLQFLVFAIVAYIVHCTYSTLFHIRLFSYYRLSRHQSDPNSLLFNTAILLRLTAPVAYNYLYLIHEVEDTAFATIMGDINSVPLFGRLYNSYFPVVIVAVCLSSTFHLASRVLRCFSVSQFDLLADDDVDGTGSGVGGVGGGSASGGGGGGASMISEDLANGKKLVFREQDRRKRGMEIDIYGRVASYGDGRGNRSSNNTNNNNNNKFLLDSAGDSGLGGTGTGGGGGGGGGSSAFRDMELTAIGAGTADNIHRSPLERSLLTDAAAYPGGRIPTRHVGSTTGRVDIFGSSSSSSRASPPIFASDRQDQGQQQSQPARKPPPRRGIIDINDL